jgi:hypothetical protein
VISEVCTETKPQPNVVTRNNVGATPTNNTVVFGHPMVVENVKTDFSLSSY